MRPQGLRPEAHTWYAEGSRHASCVLGKSLLHRFFKSF